MYTAAFPQKTNYALLFLGSALRLSPELAAQDNDSFTHPCLGRTNLMLETFLWDLLSP